MSLTTVPTEIWNQIILLLDYPSLVHLSACNRAFQSIITSQHLKHALILFESTPNHPLQLPMKVPGPSSSHTWLRCRTRPTSVPAVPWSVIQSPDSTCAQSYFFPCYTCLRLRSLASFGGKQIRYDRTLNGKDMEQRACIDCQTARTPDFSGSTRMADGTLCYTCYICKKAARKTKATTKEQRFTRYCQVCLEEQKTREAERRRKESLSRPNAGKVLAQYRSRDGLTPRENTLWGVVAVSRVATIDELAD